MVNTSWRDTVIHQRGLWTQINISNQHGFTYLHEALKYSGDELLHLSITQSWSESEHQPPSIPKFPKSVQQHLRSAMIKMDGTFDMSLRNCEDAALGYPVFERLASRYAPTDEWEPNTTFSLKSLGSLPKLHTLHLEAIYFSDIDGDFWAFPLTCLHIRDLDDGVDLQELRDALSQLSQLEHLILDSITIAAVEIQDICPLSLPSLQTLVIYDMDTLIILPAFIVPNITKLRLSYGLRVYGYRSAFDPGSIFHEFVSSMACAVFAFQHLLTDDHLMFFRCRSPPKSTRDHHLPTGGPSTPLGGEA